MPKPSRDVSRTLETGTGKILVPHRRVRETSPLGPLGAHLSIAGGMPRAVERAKALGATALQVFVKSANQWAARPFRPGEAEAFRGAARSAELEPYILGHSSYLINLASPDDVLWLRSIDAFREELERCAALGIRYLIVHPGAHMGAGDEKGLSRIARALDRALDGGRRFGRRPGHASGVMVLLETTAGQGTCLGSSFDQLATILNRAACGERLGVCFDTCHALVAGYEFRDLRSYREILRAFDRAIGLERLRAFHLNDARRGLGSRLDRHEHIGRGEVGLEAFRLILNDPRFRDVPKVLETPKGESPEDHAEDRMNLGVLRAMIGR